MAEESVGETTCDFFLQHGRPAYSERGARIVRAFEMLVGVTAKAINEGAFINISGEPNSLLERGKDVVFSACVQFCLAYVFRNARAYYDREQASLFVDDLFCELFERLPTDELYHRYLTLRESLGGANVLGVKKVSRPVQFIVDVTGDFRAGPLFIITPALTQFIFDSDALFRSDEPEKLAIQLSGSFYQRLSERLAKLETP